MKEEESCLDFASQVQLSLIPMQTRSEELLHTHDVAPEDAAKGHS